MSSATHDLWALAWGSPQVDSARLAEALESGTGAAPDDFRTRVLIRDALVGLRSSWGKPRFEEWLGRSANRERLESILTEELGRPGFDFHPDRIMEAVRPETVEQYLRELGSHVRRPVTMVIGGSIALIVARRLHRATNDIDVVNEVPGELRAQHDLLNSLSARYRLQLTHFQSHYLPSGWEGRATSLGRFGELDVQLVDVQDVFVSKLFSCREKDLDDLRVLLPQLDRSRLVERVQWSTQPLREEQKLREAAERNWYVLTGDSLPASEPA